LYTARWNLGDFLTPNILDQHSGLEDKIKQQLSHKNWKIRFAASKTLEDLDRLPSDYKVSFWDQLKIRFLDPYKI
jgi:predicted nucleic acid-binding protein